jgi:hypothetical protein
MSARTPDGRKRKVDYNKIYFPDLGTQVVLRGPVHARIDNLLFPDHRFLVRVIRVVPAHGFAFPITRDLGDDV